MKSEATNWLHMCKIPTFVAPASEMAAGIHTDKPLSSAAMEAWQRANLNPDLKACGTMAICSDCADRPQRQALATMVEHVSPVIARSNLS